MRSLSLSLLTVPALCLILAQPVFAQTPATPPADAERTAGTQPAAEVKKQDPAETYKQLNLFGDVFERVRAQYVEPISDEKLMEYAINGMLSSLDPHSSYLDDKDFSDMRIQTKANLAALVSK